MIRLLGLLLVLGSSQVFAQEYFGNENGAANGFDVVAYFTDGTATPGRAEFELEWKGNLWRFASTEHLTMFDSEPERYAPQFGGAGALTVAHGGRYPGNPNAWSIYDGRLYFFLFPASKETWLMNPDQLVPRAEQQWREWE